MRTINKLFFKEKTLEIFMEINKTNVASRICRKIDCAYSHVIKVLEHLKDSGLINKSYNGRINILAYTEKGKKLYNQFYLFLDSLNHGKASESGK